MNNLTIAGISILGVGGYITWKHFDNKARDEKINSLISLLVTDDKQVLPQNKLTISIPQMAVNLTDAWFRKNSSELFLLANILKDKGYLLTSSALLNYASSITSKLESHKE